MIHPNYKRKKEKPIFPLRKKRNKMKTENSKILWDSLAFAVITYHPEPLLFLQVFNHQIERFPKEEI